MKKKDQKSSKKKALSVSMMFLIGLFTLGISACGAGGMIGLSDLDFDLFGEDDDIDHISIGVWHGIFPYAVGTFVQINIGCCDTNHGDGDCTTGGIDPEPVKLLNLNIDGTGTYQELPGSWVYVSDTETCTYKQIFVNEVQVAGIRFTVSGGEIFEFAQDTAGVWCLVTELEALLNDAANSDNGGDSSDENRPERLIP